MTPDVNVAEVERWASALCGAALAAFGIQQSVRERSVGGALLAAAGGTLIYRGATGRCPMYAAAGISTAAETDTRAALGGSRGISVEDAVTITRPVSELYRFWRDFEQLPRFMQHLESARQLDERRSHWVVRAPGRRTVEWDAEIITDIPDKMISWRSIDGDVASAGSVHFDDAGADRGTVVRVKLHYAPPGGKLGSWAAWAFGEEPSQQVHEDLRRLKQLLETGEVPTTKGQPRGKQSVLNYD